jgi:SAM-dependent methyltransferase
VEQAMREVADWAGRDVLDLGCGTGFHLPRLAATARSVTGVEPHPGLLGLARRRAARARGEDPTLCPVEVRRGTAQVIPSPPESVDVVHVRWAYFFGPGCEPGLRELDRVVRRGGTAFVIDNDARTSTFGRWFRTGYPAVDPAVVERFWATQGWQRVPVLTRWEMESRADLEAVVRIEFDPRTAEVLLAGHQGTTVDYAVNLGWRSW